ncbi:NB-ARC domain-containing protein [Streptomyces sp. NPDC047117]|uniref:nSTAND1 domain-containing NTPase n=1 Tax=Streptomyces sp. NPDC047117 TaxID=3155379 RepID=UPI00340A38C0
MGSSRQGWKAGNLPPEATSFVGRGDELSAMADLVCTARLVTLTGSGGVGKSRLAKRAGAEARPAFPDGVWLVELSPLQGAQSIALAIYEALRLADQSSRTAAEVVTDWLADKRLLLILDCCEHLATGCADFAQTLLAAAPGVHILATSRGPCRPGASGWCPLPRCRSRRQQDATGRNLPTRWCCSPSTPPKPPPPGWPSRGRTARRSPRSAPIWRASPRPGGGRTKRRRWPRGAGPGIRGTRRALWTCGCVATLQGERAPWRPVGAWLCSLLPGHGRAGQ